MPHARDGEQPVGGPQTAAAGQNAQRSRPAAAIQNAMIAAMPLIDHFAAAHTLEELATIETDLARF